MQLFLPLSHFRCGCMNEVVFRNTHSCHCPGMSFVKSQMGALTAYFAVVVVRTCSIVRSDSGEFSNGIIVGTCCPLLLIYYGRYSLSFFLLSSTSLGAFIPRLSVWLFGVCLYWAREWRRQGLIEFYTGYCVFWRLYWHMGGCLTLMGRYRE